MKLGMRFVPKMLAVQYYTFFFPEVGYKFEAELSTTFYVKTIK